MDLSTPSVARIYDYLLGGAHNFDADRRNARRLNEIQPNVAAIAGTGPSCAGPSVSCSSLDVGNKLRLDQC